MTFNRGTVVREKQNSEADKKKDKTIITCFFTKRI